MRGNKAYIALALVCIIWGTTYMVNKIGVSHVPGLLFAGIRQLIAAFLVLLYLFITRKVPGLSKKYLLDQMVLGLLLVTGGNGLGTFGLQFIDSGISAILATTSPLMVALLVLWLHPEDRLKESGWVGLILGFLGLCIVLFQKVDIYSSPEPFLGIVFTVASVVTWSVGSVISKRKHHAQSPMLSAGFQMLFGGIPLLAASFVFESPTAYHFQWQDGLIWAYLIIFGSLVAYSAFIYSLQHLPVAMVSMHTYINPLIAVILGVAVLDEEINHWIGLGTGLCLFGVYLVNKSTAQNIKNI